MKWRYWTWLFRGLQGKPGIFKLWDRWFVLHILIAILMAFWISVPIDRAAQTLMLPLAGIFVGLSFAWAGNAQALLQSDEIERLAKQHDDGIENYIYTFQTAILTILLALVGWGLAGLRAFSVHCPVPLETIMEGVLYLISSIAFRECWSVVLGSQILILMRYNIKNGD